MNRNNPIQSKQAHLVVLFTCIMAFSLVSCHSTNKDKTNDTDIPGKPKNLVLKRVLSENRLIAATDYNSTNYFVYRGEPMGYQYELLKSFTDYLGVKLDLKIINNLDESFSCITTGNCELLAVGLTVTKDRNELFDFTEPLTQTRQMLIQRKPENWRQMRTAEEVEENLIRDPLKLAGKTVHIQQNTTYKSRLENLSDEIGEDISIVEHADKTIEQLIEMVAEGEIEYTVCDEHIALVNKKFYPEIDVSTPISFSQNVAWAVRKGSQGLLDTINDWLRKFKRTRTSAFIYNKYFRNSRSINIAKSEYYSLAGGKISPYDKSIIQYSKLINWDWRLLASLIYQESRFYPNARSWAGAFGLMQLMPHTADKYGIDSLSTPEDQIKAGVQFIGLLDKQFVDKIEDKEERTKFVLASYNAGIAHVYDARRLAQKYNKDPNRWEDNVDFYLLNKSKPEYYNDSVVKYGYCRGTEPYNFVYDILDRYNHYKNVIHN